MASEIFPTQEQAEKRFNSLCGTRVRFVILILILLCLTSVWSNILTFNFAIVCMEEDDTEHHKDNNNTTSPYNPHYDDTEIMWGISIVAIGALIGNFPIVQLVGKIGIRTVFAGLGLLSGIATLLIPLAIYMGYEYFLAVRFVQGLAFASNFPVIGAFCAKWAYYKQNGLFVSALVAYVQLAPAITMPASGALCHSFSWPAIFYVHGAVSICLFLIYAVFFRNSPGKHPLVGKVELDKISFGKVDVVQSIPYCKILKTPAIWAVWIAAIGNFTCVNMMFLFSPVYLSRVLGFPAHSTGITAALPPFAQFFSKVICGAVSDRIKCFPESWKFRLYNSFAFFGSAAFLITLAVMDDSQRNYNMFAFGAAAAMLGATTGGFFKAAPFLSQQYSHFVTGNISLGITITMIIVPFVVNALTPKETQEEWRWVFLLTAGVLIVTNIIFVIFVRGEPCEWTVDRKSSLVPEMKSEPMKKRSTISFSLDT